MKRVKNNLKKYGIFYLLCLLFAVLCTSLYADKVKAALVSQGGGGLDPSGHMAILESVERIGSWNGHNVTIMKLNGVYAFCIEPTILARKDAPYIRKEQVTAIAYKRAYAYINRYPDPTHFAAAQAYVWAMNGAGTFEEVLIGVLTSMGIKLNNTALKNVMDEIRNFSPWTGPLYLYESACGTGQRFIAAYAGNDCSTGVCDEYSCVPNDSDDDEPGGPTEEDNPASCPDPTVNIAGECASVSTYDDPGSLYDWSCIAGRTKKGEYIYLDNSTLTSKATDYCQIFCQEHAYTDFPGSNFTFEAGRYFTIGGSPYGNGWGPILITNTKYCKVYTDKTGKTEGINTTKFINDYNNIVSQIPQLYNNWKNEERKQQAIDGMSSRQANADDKWDSSCYTIHYKNSITGVPTYTVDEWGNMSSECPKDEWEDGGYCWKTEEDSTEYHTFYEKTEYEECNTSGCWNVEISGSCTKPTSNLSKALEDYNSKISTKTTLENAIKSCNNAATNFNFNPSVTMSWSDGTYSYQGNLENDKSNYNYVMYNNPKGSYSSGMSSCSGGDCILKYYNCSGDYCLTDTKEETEEKKVSISTITVSGANNSEIISEYTGISYFYAKNTGYSHILKQDGFVISGGNSNNSIYIGPDIIPLSFELYPGTYDIGFTYSNWFNYVTKKFDSGSTPLKTSEEYVCSFNLSNKIMCDDCTPGGDNGGGNIASGLDVIYRPIELGEQDIAFPGIKGNGRSPGANWIGTTSSGQSYVDAYITHNRGVEDYEVYQLEPLYTITMTPSIIKEIRNYNQKVGDYSDFNLSCVNGKNCYSEFIHDSEFAAYIGGSCGDSQAGQFDSCRTYGGA